MLGYDAERVEVLVYQTVHLTKGGRADEDVQAARRHRVRRGAAWTRSASTRRAGTSSNRGPDQAIDIDIDLAAEKTQKNPVYYVQYAHARIAGILRNAPEAPVTKSSPPGRWPTRSAS